MAECRDYHCLWSSFVGDKCFDGGLDWLLVLPVKYEGTTLLKHFSLDCIGGSKISTSAPKCYPVDES